MCLEISLKPYCSYKQAVKMVDEADLYSNPLVFFVAEINWFLSHSPEIKAGNVKMNHIV